jgi:hypothetical protein
MTQIPIHKAAEFFAYARERHAIYLRRQMCIPDSQLTKDTILSMYRFCNVFRELDTTTEWFRVNVRDRYRSTPEVLLATVVFRWFNRWQTGDAIFNHRKTPDSLTDFERLVSEQETPTLTLSLMRDTIRTLCGTGPYVTGSYIIKTPDGYPKLDGVLWCIGRFMNTTAVLNNVSMNWRQVAQFCLQSGNVSLESMWNWLRQHSHIGDFMAYEIVSDLRYTGLLEKAPDIMNWANAGPGAIRGLNRIMGRPLEQRKPKEMTCLEMQGLLSYSRSPKYWPQWSISSSAYNTDFEDIPDIDLYSVDSWPEWDMRTVEHTLCEFDKYMRVKLGEGAPRQKFHPKDKEAEK